MEFVEEGTPTEGNVLARPKRPRQEAEPGGIARRRSASPAERYPEQQGGLGQRSALLIDALLARAGLDRRGRRRRH
jgi:hypothetical protein